MFKKQKPESILNSMSRHVEIYLDLRASETSINLKNKTVRFKVCTHTKLLFLCLISKYLQINK